MRTYRVKIGPTYHTYYHVDRNGVILAYKDEKGRYRSARGYTRAWLANLLWRNRHVPSISVERVCW